MENTTTFQQNPQPTKQMKPEQKNPEQFVDDPVMTANDASFNVIHKPHDITTEPTTTTSTSTTTVKDVINKNWNVLSMENLLIQAISSFQEFVNPKLEKDKKIPFEILKDAKGIMFLTVLKGGIGIGGLFGTGIIMSRDPTWRTNWSAPCAIGIGGLQVGINIGIEKTDHIIIIRDKDVINKFHSGVRLGGDISLAIGPLGRDTNLGVNVNEKGLMPNVSYSISKGMYFGVSLEGSIVTIRNDCNEKYYGQDVDVLQILNGSTTAPFNPDYITLCQTLDDYVKSFELTNQTTTMHHKIPDEHHPVVDVTSNVKQ